VQAIRERRTPKDPRYTALSVFARNLIESRSHVAGFKPQRIGGAGGERCIDHHQLRRQHCQAAA
jgi:hypothetical protein